MATRDPHLHFAVIAVDSLLFALQEGELVVLVGDNNNPAFKSKKAFIGGVIRPEETAQDAVDRNLKDKAGIGGVFLEQLYTFSDINRDPRGRVVSVAYLGIVHTDPRSGKGTTNTAWVSAKKIKDLAYDHDNILKVGLERLRAKIGYTNIAQHFLPSTFTLTQLQKTYEAVLDRLLDKRNFRKKVLQSGLVVPTGQRTKRETKRPAQLYRFKEKRQITVEIL